MITAPGWGHLLSGTPTCLEGRKADGPCLATEFAFGQRIYTPRQDAPDPISGERPYAGWLYMAGTGQVVRPSMQDRFHFEVGLTGRLSLAETFQDAAHRFLGSSPQAGWAHQLTFEPGILVGFEHLRRQDFAVAGKRMDFVPYGGLVVGNVVTGVYSGVNARLGARDDLAWPAREGTVAEGLHMEVGLRMEAVAWDLFLDGKTSQGNSTAERIPVVRQYRLGFGYRLHRWQLAYRFTSRSREYQAQPVPHGYGSISIGYHPG
ncbi:MAG: lipid A deacylase LpxR family protein [Gemmatimonadota bacterium]|nr:lipid A deacylase LpxR family protein [Gemmatimonadota bacterium]